MSDRLPFVSVVVPVFDHADRLGACLDALERQSYPADRFEVVVVDNGARRPVADLVRPYTHARAVAEPRPGSYAARNRGVALARGEVLAFTDADCVPAATWIERGVRAFARAPGCGLLAGRIELTFRDPDRPSAVELYDAVASFRQESYVRQGGFAATANLFTSRPVIDRVGGFDETLKSGGDMEWGQRVRAQGYVQSYADDAVVTHPARRTVRELCRRTLRIAGGMQDVARKRRSVPRALFVDVPSELVPLKKIWRGLADERLEGLGRKVSFAALVWLVGLVRATERLRVQLGGASRRV